MQASFALSLLDAAPLARRAAGVQGLEGPGDVCRVGLCWPLHRWRAEGAERALALQHCIVHFLRGEGAEVLAPGIEKGL